MNASLKDTVPPHNSEAESATLGAMLLDQEAVSRVLRHLRPEDFYSSYNQNVYAAILGLFNKGMEIDLITLTDELRTNGKLEAGGGAAYISTLTSVVPTSANVEYYARIVKDHSIRRNLLKISAEMTANCFNETLESRELIEEAEKQIFDITESQQSGSYRGANEIINETIAAIEKLYHTKESYTGVPSGFPDLDSMTSGFQKAEFIVIGARPSVGKTAFALSVAANMCVKKQVPVGFFTLEMSAQALMQRLVSSEARINSKNLRNGFLKPSDFHNLTEAAGRIYEAPLFIDDTPNIKLLDLRAQARRMRSKEGIEAIFIDYIGLIEPENKGNIPRHEQVAEISRSIKSLARELDIPIVCLSQVGRQSEGKAPSLADLRESGSIEQDADVVMFLHRERENTQEGESENQSIKTELILAKQRNGPVGTIPIAFVPKYTKFESFSKDH